MSDDDTAEREHPYILIVEDDLDLSEMLNAYFRALGYESFTAAWGEDAVALTSEDPPDLILLDVRLPDIDGYEVCRRLRLGHRTKFIPIIFLTERRDRIDKLTGLEYGGIDYITKPFDIHELRLRVRNALRRTHQPGNTNLVTGLADGALVDEMLNGAVRGSKPWGALVVSLTGIERFREQFGFLAADDVLRSAGLILHNAQRETGGSEEAAGQLSAYDFFALTDPDHLTALRQRVEERLTQSIQLFYPFQLADENGDLPVEDRLQVKIGQLLSSEGPFDALSALKTALLNAWKTAK
ncbi:MAG TPA: response regulator transcription factor [Aggregatilinea sp.]|jgi:DNA-binding response OmpR family regulator|uniref:response regulator transcription factor n=1 Tax=Aggregatilinea sp. TaxID=2806333 RepID=UPI002C10F8D0|nr:response regulator transcription factor [Aggregatilinea sp.]HML21569.1 response regulator transcription factor [Aggregatilinea sp.]